MESLHVTGKVRRSYADFFDFVATAIWRDCRKLLAVGIFSSRD
jgi:hypothetical protein